MSARPRKRGRRSGSGGGGGGGGGGGRQDSPSVKKKDLEEKTMAELREMAKELELDTGKLRKKEELVAAVYEAKAEAEGFVQVSGVLDVLPEGYGFLRTDGYLPGDDDVYCSMSQIRRFSLRRGDLVTGQVRPPKDSEKYPALLRVHAINDKDPEEARGRTSFRELTPLHPDERFRLEHGQEFLTARIMDLVAPIGKGQRGLIVSPPKAGKTTILKDIAHAISANNPEVVLLCLLVDERPEEVTEMERSIDGEVISSTFDMPSDNHTAVAELTLERAKRLVESGYDVVILLDSITRLARAYNLATPASGRILSGGVDSTALYPPKRFFGAARNIEFGGSLTILATALVETGSKMDEVIFEEFKGTGNMELRLQRDYADRRIFPAIDVIQSGTRKEELLLDPIEAPFVWGIRRLLHGVDSGERAIEMLIKGLKQTETNEEFLRKMSKRAQDAIKTNGNGV
jgi:transcription termination factor Rho